MKYLDSENALLSSNFSVRFSVTQTVDVDYSFDWGVANHDLAGNKQLSRILMGKPDLVRNGVLKFRRRCGTYVLL